VPASRPGFRSRRAARLLGLALAAAAAGCAGDGASDAASAPEPRHVAPVRIVDVLRDRDWIAGSPLGPYPAEQLLGEGFENTLDGWRVLGGDPAQVRIEAVATGAIEGARSLRVAARAERPAELPVVARTVAVLPRATYRLRAAVRTLALAPLGERSLGASVELVERAGDAILAHHRHLPRERGTSAQPRVLEYLFETQSATSTLEVRLVAALGPATGAADFDALRLERVDAREVLARAEPVVRDPGADPRGRLRALTIGGDRRPAVLALPGDEWTLALRAQRDVALRFALAAPAGVLPGTRLCFRVDWSGGSDAALFEECLESDRPPAWLDRRVDLAHLATRDGTLRFRTEIRRGPGNAAAAGAGAGAWGNPRLTRDGPRDARPDIVLMVFDTLRADHLGFAGYARRPTSPQLDALARRALRYSRAYTPSPWTAPALGSLVTSRSPHVHGAGQRIPREVRGDPAVDERPARNVVDYRGLSPRLPTLAQAFRAAGYETAGFHSNYFFGAPLGFGRGFDVYRQYDGKTEEGARTGVRLALDWLGARPSGQPALLVLHCIDPHMPLRMRRKFFPTFGPPAVAADWRDETSGAVGVQRWEEHRDVSDADLERIVAMYDSEIAWMDEALAPLLDAALASDPTILVALSDHGEGLREHGWVGHGDTLFEELLRVPLLLRLPGDAGAGSVVDEPVSLLDVAPTLLALAGLAPWPDAEGRPLPGVLAAPRPPRELAFDAMFLGPDRSALLRDGFKYVWTHPRGWLGFQAWEPAPGLGGRGEPLLFDVAGDPAETRNLAAAEPERAADLRARLLARLARTEPGLHVYCPAGPRRGLRIESDSTVAEIKPLDLESGDGVVLDAARRRLDLDLGGAEDPAPVRSDLERGDWVVVRFSEPAPVRLGAAGAAPAPLGGPGAPPADLGAARDCVTWTVLGAESPASLILDEGQRARLEALGYL